MMDQYDGLWFVRELPRIEGQKSRKDAILEALGYIAKLEVELSCEYAAEKTKEWFFGPKP